MNQQVEQLKAWYDGKVRDFLTEHMPAKVADLEAALGRIEGHDRRVDEELAICLLGDSGIGKSTLINALVAGKEMILPSGGIGPLTALAMEVRYGAEATLEAEYHGAHKLWRGVIFGLEQGYQARLKAETGNAVDVSFPSDALAGTEGDDEDRPEALLTPTQGDPETSRRLEAFQKQAQLLVKGNQDVTAELPYLLDCLREAAGSKRAWGTILLDQDAGRVRSLAAALAMGKEGRIHRSARTDNPAAFEQDLRDHASGFLAPLIKNLHVRWPSPLLEQRIVLVDLPGVGVAGDVYKEVTRKWIFERAKAVVLVVGRAGVTEGAADLLRTSDFLTRLLFSRDERSHDPVVLAVAVSHLDDVAQEEWARDRSKKKAQHLAEQFERARALIRSQLRLVLERVWESGDENVRSGQKEIIERLANEALVFPVSAPEYRRCLAQDDEDRAFISTPDQSGVPAMEAGLRETVRARREDAARARSEAIQAFIDQVVAWVEFTCTLWAGGGHTDDEIDRFEKELEAMMAPLRKEFLVRQGQFRGFLKKAMPAVIDKLVAEAKESAYKEISRYLRSLKDAHWATLKAAVRKEGTHYGARAINLPEDFARKFVEPVAQVWGTSIIQQIRKETKDFAGDCEQQVVHVAEWCRSEGARVSPKLLDAQLEAIRADIKQIDLAGREVINELRDQVKNQLSTAIEKPIREKCRKFVKAGDHEGPGVKHRILDLFDTLAEDATAAAATAAGALLTTRFKEVEAELREVLKDLDDPLETAADNILKSYRGQLQRADIKNRERVLADCATVLQSKPAATLAALLA